MHMPADYQSLYIQLGRLVQSMPDLTAAPPNLHQWLASAYALCNAVGEVAAAMEIAQETHLLTGSRITPGSKTRDLRQQYAADTVMAAVHRALAVAELKAPAPVQGAFIPVGHALDAMAAFGKVVQKAARDVLVVDPYMDEKAVLEFAPLSPDTANIRLLADRSGHKPTLAPAASRWREQYPGRALEVRLAQQRGSLHDRLIILDSSSVWLITQSLNKIATRSPASIVQFEGDAVPLKLAAYNSLWDGWIHSELKDRKMRAAQRWP